jgi:hypothetical protein
MTLEVTPRCIDLADDYSAEDGEETIAASTLATTRLGRDEGGRNAGLEKAQNTCS